MKKILSLLAVILLSAMSQAVIIYVDADFTADTGNTLLAPSAGGGVVPTNTTDTVDGIWRYRSGFGLKPTDTVIPTSPIDLAGGTVYESAGNSGADNVPRIVTTVVFGAEHL